MNELKIVEHKNQRVLTTQQLAESYEEMMQDSQWFVNYENLKSKLEETMLLWEQIAEELE